MAQDIKVLLVDDDEFLLDMYSVELKSQGFTVDTASKGELAIEKLEQNTYDAVLLDIVMPHLDGYGVLQRIRGEHLAGEPIVLMLSNLGQKEGMERVVEQGANDYIVKAHVTPKEVAEKVSYHLAKKS